MVAEGNGPSRKMANTILVVDDEKNIVQLARLYLGNEGFHVEEAYDGRQALEKARSVHPDLVILDIMMPEMDGLTVCKELRKTSTQLSTRRPSSFSTTRRSVSDDVIFSTALLSCAHPVSG